MRASGYSASFQLTVTFLLQRKSSFSGAEVFLVADHLGKSDATSNRDVLCKLV